MGAIGRALSDAVAVEFGWLIEPISMSNPMKAEIAERMKGAVEGERVGLPPRNSKIKDDVCALKRCISEKGVVTYDGTSGTSHCDRAWALGLAIKAAFERNSVSIASHSQLPNTRQRALAPA
jgi:phage FluMu gp28-like protein